MNKTVKAIIAALAIAAFLFLAWCISPAGRANVNTWFFHVQKADDETRYRTRKEVEDTCRSMIASYTSDCFTYEQYKDSDNEEKQSWGEQARIRANKTAASYNEFILKNSFVWAGNVPEDIKFELPFI